MSDNDTAENQSTLPSTGCSQPLRPLRRYRTGSDVSEKRKAMDAAAKEIREGWIKAESDHISHWSKMDDQSSLPETEKSFTSKQSSKSGTDVCAVSEKFNEEPQSQPKASIASSPTTPTWKDKFGARFSGWNTSIGGKR
ncbi:hypothetical protein V866_003231 [Kwoniella sp. B9012]